MPITARDLGEKLGYTRVAFYDGTKLMGSLAFPIDSYHDDWDKLVDFFIKTATPPGLPEPE